MARPRSIPDSTVLAAVRRLLSEGGEKAVAFSAVARATGLAPASLAQRYGTIAGMIEAAAADAVDQALAALERVEGEVPDKGPQGLLKALGEAGPDAAALAVLMRSPAGRDRALAFRHAVEAAIARRLSPKQAADAPMLFAAWMGGRLWSATGEAGFRLKDLVKKLG
jgi:AcrR family transcriptional regulator